jgi:hypothetical protein
LAVGLALLLLSSFPASATTLLRLGTQDLLEMSPVVVLGEVLDQETRLATDGGYPITLTTIAVEESFKDSTAPFIKVLTLGGQVDDLIGEVAGACTFRPGERVVLFLSPKEGWEDTYVVAGMFQGKWTVTQDVSGETVLVNDRADLLLANPAREIVPADAQGRLPLAAFLQAVRSWSDGQGQ